MTEVPQIFSKSIDEINNFRRQCDDGKYVAVVERKPDIKLSKEFCNVLADIFTKADLDANGTLSR